MAKVMESDTRMESLLKEIDAVQKHRNKVSWNTTIDRYVEVLSKFSVILSDSSIVETIAENTLPKIESFISQCTEPEFHIAIIGVVKAGKSTLINALLGKELASTAVTPETAVLTKFRAGRGKNYVKIKFYSQEEWNELWKSVQENTSSTFLKEYKNLNAESVKNDWLDHEEVYAELDNEEDLKQYIKEWTSSQEPKHYFVKEVEVGLDDFSLPEQVVFVDTPGLNDVVRYRSDVTRKYIDRANAVILCALSKTLNTGDLQAIYNVFANCRYNPQKVYTLGTQVDLLNDPKIEWPKIKRQWISYLEGPDCYNSRILAEHNIFGLSSYLYNQSLQFNQMSKKEQRIFELTLLKYDAELEDPIQEAEACSEILAFKGTLFKEIINKHETLLLEELKARFDSIRQELIEQMAYIKQSQKEILVSADSSLDDIARQQKEKAQELKEITVQQVELKDVLNQIRQATNERNKMLKKEMKALV